MKHRLIGFLTFNKTYLLDINKYQILKPVEHIV